LSLVNISKEIYEIIEKKEFLQKLLELNFRNFNFKKLLHDKIDVKNVLDLEELNSQNILQVDKYFFEKKKSSKNTIINVWLENEIENPVDLKSKVQIVSREISDEHIDNIIQKHQKLNILKISTEGKFSVFAIKSI
jgi:hypothetical protein